VYLDEQADSINDAAYFSPTGNRWPDLPASYHNGAGSLAFADGHSEIHKWQSSVLTRKVTTQGYTMVTVGANDKDYWWLRERTQRVPGQL
jgi:prepilin-type processing-associated H-X9-DG protein